jgi:glycine cleavage system aminomethyltransferase T
MPRFGKRSGPVCSMPWTALTDLSMTASKKLPMRSSPKASRPLRTFESAGCSRRRPRRPSAVKRYHLDRAGALITGPKEREQVAELNLIAGKRAKAAAAYVAALQYFSAGRGLLGEDGWELSCRLERIPFTFTHSRRFRSS